MGRKVLAVETGGSKFITGVLEEGSKQVLGRYEVGIKAEDSEEYIENIITFLEKSLKKAGFDEEDVESVGVVSAGKWTEDRNLVQPPNLPFEYEGGIPLGKKISERFNVPVFAENDVNAGVLAEIIFGAGRNFEGRYVGYLTISSGIGLGIYDKKHGEIFRGEHGQAPEIGHNKVVDKGFICGCGGNGHWEAYGSGNGLENIYEQLSGEFINAKKIIEKCDEDKICDRAVSLMAYYNAIGVGHIINSFQPGLLIFGGSPVFKHPKKVFGRIKELLNKGENDFSFIDVQSFPEMIVSELGEDNILYGAGAVAIKEDQEDMVR